MFGFGKNKHKSDLLKTLHTIPDAPPGFFSQNCLVAGGLSEIGFSQHAPHLQLVITSSGRGVIDCNTGDKIARDKEEYADWYDPYHLTCTGIGPLANETIRISGLCGGGLPTYNVNGDSLVRVSPEWPLETLYWCPPGKNVLFNGHQSGCFKMANDYFLCAGFSWDGRFVVSATSSDITIWKRNVAD